MRFLIAACKENPEKQRALFIMSYIKMMDTDMDGKISMDELEIFLLKALVKHGIDI